MKTLEERFEDNLELATDSGERGPDDDFCTCINRAVAWTQEEIASELARIGEQRAWKFKDDVNKTFYC